MCYTFEIYSLACNFLFEGNCSKIWWYWQNTPILFILPTGDVSCMTIQFFIHLLIWCFAVVFNVLLPYVPVHIMMDAPWDNSAHFSLGNSLKSWAIFSSFLTQSQSFPLHGCIRSHPLRHPWQHRGLYSPQYWVVPSVDLHHQSVWSDFSSLFYLTFFKVAYKGENPVWNYSSSICPSI